MMAFRLYIARKSIASDKSTLATLCLLLVCVLAHSVWAETKQSAMQKYPPYPDVWHRMLPGPKFEYRSLHFFPVENGDYFIAYTKGTARHKDGSLVYGGLYFFSGWTLDSLHINDLVPPKYQLVQGTIKLTLPQGLSIALKNLDPRLPQRCPQNLNYYYVIDDARRGTSEKRSLLYILDRPRKQKVDPLCADTVETIYYEKVVAIQGELIALPDGGIFIYGNEGGGLVLRFDAQLQTHSPLLKKKLFWVDTSLVSQWRREGDVDYQQMHDGILRTLRKEMTK
jgi:hypothetical protein